MNDFGIIILFFVLSNFWKIIYYLCQEIHKTRDLQISSVSFQLQTFKFENLRLRQSGHTRLSDKLFKNGFVVFYNHYLPKKIRIKKPSAEVKI
jgi:hypothetical protein